MVGSPVRSTVSQTGKGNETHEGPEPYPRRVPEREGQR